MMERSVILQKNEKDSERRFGRQELFMLESSKMTDNMEKEG